MKTELPKFKDWMAQKGHTFPEVSAVEEYGELCAKYGAKSIRYQAIDMVLDKFSGAHSTLYKLIADELVSEIQNLEP